VSYYVRPLGGALFEWCGNQGVGNRIAPDTYADFDKDGRLLGIDGEIRVAGEQVHVAGGADASQGAGSARCRGECVPWTANVSPAGVDACPASGIRTLADRYQIT
jgi:hypothetical protein